MASSFLEFYCALARPPVVLWRAQIHADASTRTPVRGRRHPFRRLTALQASPTPPEFSRVLLRPCTSTCCAMATPGSTRMATRMAPRIRRRRWTQTSAESASSFFEFCCALARPVVVLRGRPHFPGTTTRAASWPRPHGRIIACAGLLVGSCTRRVQVRAALEKLSWHRA